MANFIAEQIWSIIGLDHIIRSILLIAHVDHGKTTLTDSLVQKSCIISSKSFRGACYTDICTDNAKRGITVKFTGIFMLSSMT